MLAFDTSTIIYAWDNHPPEQFPGLWKGTMQAFDTSTIIYAWDNYPPEQFPGLWRWMAKKVESGEFVMLDVAFLEFKKKSLDLKEWLEDHKLRKFEITDATIQNALMIKTLLGTENDKYGVGVGENDILIIASAKEHHIELVTNESLQNKLPKEKRNIRFQPYVICLRLRCHA